MILDKKIEKIVFELVLNKNAKVDIFGFTVTARVLDDVSRVLLTTPVYHGGNYISDSVRRGTKEKPPFSYGKIQANLSIHEDKFQINLDYAGHIHCVDCKEFTHLVEEFCWLAEKWRDYLDEHDKKDLIRIPIK